MFNNYSNLVKRFVANKHNQFSDNNKIFLDIYEKENVLPKLYIEFVDGKLINAAETLLNRTVDEDIIDEYDMDDKSSLNKMINIKIDDFIRLFGFDHLICDCSLYTILFDDCLCKIGTHGDFISSISFTSDKEKYVRECSQYIIDILNNCKQELVTNNDCKFAYISNNYISTLDFKPKTNYDIDVKKNYNDDLPYNELKELLLSNRQELVLLYGEAGTGKSSLIKHLISEISKPFILFDYKMLNGIDNSMMIEFLSNNKNAIFVLEDCENMLMSREKGNDMMSTLLNLTDGIFGEYFGIKFICTFNSDINKIDKALLRKGRMSLMYEFKKLSLDKTKAIYQDATTEMTLADIYNISKQVDFSSKDNKRKIGF